MPAFALGGLIVAATTGTARAQGTPPPQKSSPAAGQTAPKTAVAPPVRPVRFNDAWEYRYYFCGAAEPCAQDGGKGAYAHLNTLGDEGWEAYGYVASTTGFNWELKRRR